MRSPVHTLPGKLLAGAFLGAILAFGAASIEPLASRHEAMADSASDIAVGTQLQATEDVQISRAEIARGSKVSVTNVVVRQGDPTSVDIALADGQVLKKVGIGTIRNYFRVVGS